MSRPQFVYRLFQGQHLPMSARQPVALTRAPYEFRNEPDDVAVVEILTGRRTGPAQGSEERTVHSHCQFGPPTAQGRHLDLQLRHQALRAGGAPVGPSDIIRKGQPPSLMIAQNGKLGLHAGPGKVHSLDLQAEPAECVPKGLGHHQIDLACRFAGMRVLHERHFASHAYSAGIKTDDLCQPADQKGFFLKTRRTYNHGIAFWPAQLSILGQGVPLQRTYAAGFVAGSRSRLERTRQCSCRSLQRDARLLLASGRGQLQQRLSVPFGDAESTLGRGVAAHDAKRGCGVITSSGNQA